MSEFAPITLAVAWMLDPGELVAGYAAGAEDQPEPAASSFSLAFQHGWACGQSAAGLRAPSPEMVAVAYAFGLAKTCTAACDPTSGPCLPMH